MLLKNPVIRHGIAFLEQNSVELLGYQTADREALQKMDFARGLRFRMGYVYLCMSSVSIAKAFFQSTSGASSRARR